MADATVLCLSQMRPKLGHILFTFLCEICRKTILAVIIAVVQKLLDTGAASYVFRSNTGARKNRYRNYNGVTRGDNGFFIDTNNDRKFKLA